MAALFADLPEAIENTVEIARRCAFRVHSRDPILPRFAEGDEAKNCGARRAKARGAARRRAAWRRARRRDDYRERLEFELDVIIKMKFPGYFLIVADFIKYAKSQGIPVGPGRGSGAGSLVAYALTITDLDPFRFNLLFERFLNPERVSMPDFDIDFCQDRRDEVIDYVQQRYGADRVAQIITFGKLQARAVCRDVGPRAADALWPGGPALQADPDEPGQSGDARAGHRAASRGFRKSATGIRRSRPCSRSALKLEGLYRHASTHAAGIVIGDRPLEELVPLYRDPRSTLARHPVQHEICREGGAGQVRLPRPQDADGHRQGAEAHPRARAGLRYRQAFPTTTNDTYEMLGTWRHGRGVPIGKFGHARRRSSKMHADRIEDIIAIVALYRPGPMDNIPRFIACKKGRSRPTISIRCSSRS